MLETADELPRAPVKQKSLASLNSSSDGQSNAVIEVRVIEGVDLVGKEAKKKMDPYCKVVVGRKMKKTKPINGGGPNPKWNSTLNFEA